MFHTVLDCIRERSEMVVGTEDYVRTQRRRLRDRAVEWIINHYAINSIQSK